MEILATLKAATESRNMVAVRQVLNTMVTNMVAGVAHAGVHIGQGASRLPFFHNVGQEEVWGELDFLAANPDGDAGGRASIYEMIVVYKVLLAKIDILMN